MSRHRRTARARGTESAAGRPKTPRQRRVGEELRHVLAQVLERGEMRDPDLRGVSITVTEVDASPDLRNAVAFVMPLAGADRERVMAAPCVAPPPGSAPRWRSAWSCATRPTSASSSTAASTTRTASASSCTPPT